MPAIRGSVVEQRTRDALSHVLVGLHDARAAIAPLRGSASSRIDGSFEFEDVPSGLYLLRFQRDDPSGQTSSGSMELEVGAEDIEVRFQLEVRGLVEGKVLDRIDHSPIQGAVIRISPDTGGQIASPADRSGTYRIGFVVPGQYHLVGSARGYNTGTTEVIVAPLHQAGTTVHDFLLDLVPAQEQFGAVVGNVQGRRGAGIFGARVELLKDSQVLQIGSVIKEYVDLYHGNFRFDRVPFGSYGVRASFPGFQPTTVPITVKAGRDNWAEIQLEPAAEGPPPQLENVYIEPSSITEGESLKIVVTAKTKARGTRATAQLWGPAGWNMGFTLDTLEPDGSLSRTFERWDLPGRFVINSVRLEDQTGRTDEIGTNVVFEVFPKRRPLTPDSPVFKVPR